MKTIVVPTDFNIENLKIIDSLASTANSGSLRIIFLHAFKISDSISDMLMLNRRSRDYENVSDEFYDKLNEYKAKYPQEISKLEISYFYGSTTAAFKNFLEGFDVDFIAYPKDYTFNALNKFSIDPSYIISRSGCTIIELDVKEVARAENLFETKIPEIRYQTVSA